MASLKRKCADLGDPVLVQESKKQNDGLSDSGDRNEPQLHEDALSLVMQFLGPRELYHLAFSSKALMSRVTTSLVMRATAVNYTGRRKHPKDNLATLKYLVEHRAIHLPSPLRLLRLVNGFRCEFCNLKRVNTIRGHGCFLCPSCVEESTESLSREERSMLPRSFKAGSHDRDVRCTAPWKQTRYAGGEVIGPVVLHRHVLDVIKRRGEKWYVLPQPYKDTSLALRRDAFLKDYKDAMLAETRMRMLLRSHALQKAVALQEKRAASLAKFIEQVRSHLDERWRDFALALDDRPWRITRLHANFSASLLCTETDDGLYTGVPFRCPFVWMRLQTFAKSPSKARQKFAYEAAQDINRVYERILSSDLLSFTFLIDLPGLSGADRERLIQHARAKYQGLQAFVHEPMFGYSERYWIVKERTHPDFWGTFSIVKVWMEQNFGHLLLDAVSAPWELGFAQRIVLCRSSCYYRSEQLIAARSEFRQVRERARSFLVWLRSQDDVDESVVHRIEAGIAAYDPSCARNRFHSNHALFLEESFEDIREYLEEHQLHNLALEK